MKPATALWARSLMSITARLLLSALATNSNLRLGSNSSAFGVDPSGAFGVRLVEIVSIIVRVLVSMTRTVLSFEQATNRRPSAPRTMSLGLAPTSMVVITLLVAVSMTLTLRLDQ